MLPLPTSDDARAALRTHLEELLRTTGNTAPLDPAANQLTLPAIVVDAAPLRFELHYNAQAPLTLKTLQLTPATITLQKP